MEEESFSKSQNFKPKTNVRNSLNSPVYIINEMKKSQKAQEKPKESFRQALPQFRGKMCEITLEEPLVMIDAVFSVKGILVDADDEWVMMETISRKKKLRRYSE